MLPKTLLASTPHEPTTNNNAGSWDQLGRSAPVRLVARRILAAPQADRPHPLSNEEYVALVAVAERDAKTSDLKDVVAMVYHCGLRRRAGRAALERGPLREKVHLDSFPEGGMRRVHSGIRSCRCCRYSNGGDGRGVRARSVSHRHLKQMVTQLSALSPTIRTKPVSLPFS
jgi:hypothetical protein